jgi:predicted nuclease with TOPRIM domain
MERQLKAVSTERDELSSKLDAQQEEIDALAFEKESAEGRADALEERLAEFDNGSARIDTAELDQLVADRLSTLQNLAPAFADDFKFDGIDDASLYNQAFENLTGNAPREDAEPSYIQGVVDGILAARADSEDEEGEDDAPEGEGEVAEDGEAKEDAADARSDSSAALRNALKGAGSANATPESVYRSKMADAWKRPLTATK